MKNHLDIHIGNDKGESRHWYDPHTKKLDIYIGNGKVILLVNNQAIRNCYSFKLRLQPILTTAYEYCGAGPSFVGISTDTPLTEEYPLHIIASDTADSVIVLVENEPVGGLATIELDLRVDYDNGIRLVSHWKQPKKIVNALIKLGVKIEYPNKNRHVLTTDIDQLTSCPPPK